MMMMMMMMMMLTPANGDAGVEQAWSGLEGVHDDRV